jgi:hypothetical protein
MAFSPSRGEREGGTLRTPPLRFERDHQQGGILGAPSPLVGEVTKIKILALAKS